MGEGYSQLLLGLQAHSQLLLGLQAMAAAAERAQVDVAAAVALAATCAAAAVATAVRQLDRRRRRRWARLHAHPDDPATARRRRRRRQLQARRRRRRKEELRSATSKVPHHAAQVNTEPPPPPPPPPPSAPATAETGTAAETGATANTGVIPNERTATCALPPGWGVHPVTGRSVQHAAAVASQQLPFSLCVDVVAVGVPDGRRSVQMRRAGRTLEGRGGGQVRVVLGPSRVVARKRPPLSPLGWARNKGNPFIGPPREATESSRRGGI